MTAAAAIPSPRRALRRVGAVLAGFVTIVVLSVGTDAALHAAGVYPPLGESMSDGLFVLATAYRIVFGIAGCWVAARLAPDRPMQHALALGAFGVVVSIAGAIATWGKDLGPAWYPIAIVLISMPCAYVGGWLRERTARRPSPAALGVAR